MPKGTDAEKDARELALQAGYKAAVEVPLSTTEACVEALELALQSAGGNKNSASDAGVAALMARAGVHGAALNVLINLGSIHDAEYAGKTRGKVAALRGRADELCAEAVRAVEEGFR